MTGTHRPSRKHPANQKNGFYTPLFHANETNELNCDPNPSLEGEIAMLRVMIRRTMELAEGVDDLRQATRVLDALGAASTRLANLLRMQKGLLESDTHLVEEISSAIQQLNLELRRKNE
jgi:hypothetical protein